MKTEAVKTVNGGKIVWEAAPRKAKGEYSVPSTVKFGDILLPRLDGEPFQIPTAVYQKHDSVKPPSGTRLTEVEATSKFREVGASTVEAINFKEFVDKLDNYALYHKIIATVGCFNGFQHTHLKPTPENVSFFVAYSKHRGLLETFQKGYDNGDHYVQGSLLGYPKCCTENFVKLTRIGYVDNLVPYLMHGEDNSLTTPTLRYGGWRLVPFLACSPKCKNAIRVAKKYEELIDNWWKGLEYKIVVQKGLAVIEVYPIRIYTGTVRFKDKLTFEGTYA